MADLVYVLDSRDSKKKLGPYIASEGVKLAEDLNGFLHRNKLPGEQPGTPFYTEETKETL